MPRLPPCFLRHAAALNPLLPLLLRTCRTIPSAHNELRWLREHVETTLTAKFGRTKDVPASLRHRCVAKLARQRSRGVPLQYLLGSQPFGDLDIKCGKGVLIPRQCTEAYTETLARLIAQHVRQLHLSPKRLRIIDFCTGTGCIPLLLLSLLSKSLPHIYLDITGVDISQTALALSKKNYAHNLLQLGDPSRHSMVFEYADLLDPRSQIRKEDVREHGDEDSVFTVVVSNPPYISKEGFEQQTERSVRNFEPRLALVPRRVEATDLDGGFPEDIFYVAIAERAEKLGAKMMLLEVAGTEQAVRVAKVVMHSHPGYWRECQIWGDEPNADEKEVEDLRLDEKSEMEGLGVEYRGTGPGRTVYFCS